MSTNRTVQAETLEEEKQFNNFLCSTKLLKIIEEKTDQFINKYISSKQSEDVHAPIVLDLHLFYREFVERSQLLLHLLVEEPTQFQDLAERVVLSVVKNILKTSLKSPIKTIDSEQVHVRFRFIGLPIQENLIYDIVPNKYPTNVAVLNCVLSGYTEPESYTLQSVWYCSTGCQVNAIKKQVTKEPNCYNCARPMSEYSRLRCTGTYRLLRVFSILSVSTPNVVNKIFHSQVVRLYDYAYDCEIKLGANMESSETLNTSLSAVKSIPDEDLDDLLIFSQKGSVENANLTDFQYREVMEMTADLFRDDDEEGLTFKQKTQKYPQEFNLSFSSGTPDPSLLLNTQKSESIELSCGTPFLQDNLEESVFVHPQMKNEPLDLSVPSVQFSPAISSKLENQSNDDLDLEFSADPFSSISRPNESDIYASEDDPYKIGPSSSRACKSSMEFLTQSYSQVSLEDEEEILNKRRNLYSTKAQKDFTQIPSSVQRLYDTIKVAYSDFAFVYSLSAQMCQEKVPMDCFVHLKIGLLLSIASLEDNPDRPPISVVAIGPEFDMASLLMEHIGSVAERFVGPDDDFKVPANEDSKHTWIHADPIVMASGGIFFVGDWGRLRASRSFRLFKIIECGQVPLEKTTVTCDLEAAIWTHWRSYKFNTKDQHLFNKFIEIFGIPLIIEDDNHEALVNFILSQSSINKPESTVDELSIGTDDMRDFLAIVSKRRVDLTEEASEILRKYFIASRMDRPDCLAQKSFTTLKLFAESFAKLSLRHDVVLIDAISAVYMAENMIQNLFGAGAYPPPEFKTHSFIGDVDEHMMKFQEWLENYISRY